MKWIVEEEGKGRHRQIEKTHKERSWNTWWLLSKKKGLHHTWEDILMYLTLNCWFKNRTLLTKFPAPKSFLFPHINSYKTKNRAYNVVWCKYFAVMSVIHSFLYKAIHFKKGLPLSYILRVCGYLSSFFQVSNTFFTMMYTQLCLSISFNFDT